LESAANTGIEAVIVRSPLIYGPGVRANFLRLMRWVDNGWPLPLDCIRNSRSLVSIWSLCDLLIETITNPSAAGPAWMVSDGHDLSTPQLISGIAHAMKRPARLLLVPVSVLRFCGALSGLGPEITRLIESLSVDIRKTSQVLGWSPRFAVNDALARTVTWYLSEYRARAH
jgi:nucleoside-diphosphate-sugar epimerase